MRKTSCKMILGCESLGGQDWGEVDIEENIRAVQFAEENGVEFFDTANVYGLGLSELRLGQVLKSPKSKIITKVGLHWRSSGSQRAEIWRDHSSSAIFHSFYESLERLKRKDVFGLLIHWPDNKTSLAETMEACERLVANNKISTYGFSNFTINAWREIIALKPTVPLLSQFSFNYLERTAQAELLPLFFQNNVFGMAYGALAQGLLVGKYKADHQFAENDRRRRLKLFNEFQKNQSLLKAFELEALEAGLSSSEFALSWVVRQKEVSAVVVGCKTVEQVAKNLRVFNMLSNSQ